MAIGEADQEHQREMEKETESDVIVCTDDSDDDSDDDSVDDPSFDIVEETRSALSEISINKPRSRKCKDGDVNLGTEEEIEALESKIPKLDKKEEKTFEKVEELIRGGDLEKLKIDQCKLYLRKYGLRLTGNKSVLISRIAEHLQIIDGCGEKKYPPESFVLNCKGDACLGDVVIFEQNVYEMFSIVSRSATGPSCGTRTVAGRIVKESYGAAKQQHTFTIEVLWSKGMKPWPPLHPLLIKGRNLYRIKTMRQRWADEGKRQQVLQEKHARGFWARSSRDLRIQEKERRKNGLVIKRKNLTKNSTGHKENHHPQPPRLQQISNNKEQQISKNKEKQKHQQEIRSNSATSGSNQQARDVPVPQRPVPTNLGKPKTAEHGIFLPQAYRVSEYDNRTHVGTSQAPNPLNNGYVKHSANHHHSQHHNHPRANPHGPQQSLESRNSVFVTQPHDHRHHYNTNYYPHHLHQTLSAKHPIHPVQQQRYPPAQLRYPGLQKEQ